MMLLLDEDKKINEVWYRQKWFFAQWARYWRYWVAIFT